MGQDLKPDVILCPACRAPGFDPRDPKCIACGAALRPPTHCVEPECMARQRREALEELARQSESCAPRP